jgi:raffinose/stachyose/melibiose transport system permease protein
VTGYQNPQLGLRRAARGLRARWFLSAFGAILPLGLYFLLVAVPIGATIYLSFTQWDGLGSAMHFIGFRNYTALASDHTFWLACENSGKWVVLTLTIPVLLGLLAAVVLASPRVIASDVIRAAIFAPTTMSLIVLGLVWTLVYNPVFGALNEAVTKIGAPGLQHDWLGDPSTALYALIAAASWQYTGFAMILFSAGLQQIPSQLYDAARVDGAPAWRIFRHVTLPGLKPITAVVVVLSIINSLRVFDLVFVMTNGGPYQQTDVLGFYLYEKGFAENMLGYAAAIGVVILVMSLGACAIYLYVVGRRQATVRT